MQKKNQKDFVPCPIEICERIRVGPFARIQEKLTASYGLIAASDEVALRRAWSEKIGDAPARNLTSVLRQKQYERKTKGMNAHALYNKTLAAKKWAKKECPDILEDLDEILSLLDCPDLVRRILTSLCHYYSVPVDVESLEDRLDERLFLALKRTDYTLDTLIPFRALIAENSELRDLVLPDLDLLISQLTPNSAIEACRTSAC